MEMFLSKSIKLEWVNKILVSSAKIIGAKVLFIILGKSFTYKRKIRGPKIEPCGIPCLILAQFETLLLFSMPLYRMSQEECARLREGVPYVKVYRYNPKHLCPNLNSYGDNGQRSLKLWQLLHTCWLPNTY